MLIMSFKREGDDKGLLDNLRRQRIKELLAEDIPEDEAKLLCNGRFTCLVCSQRPIFDTVNMLMVHRQGKKHITAQEEFNRKKKELQVLIWKRKHEQYLKDGTTNIRQAASSSSGGILSSLSYDPRVKKHKVKPYERKPRIDLLKDETSSASVSLPKNTTIPLKHSCQLKNIFQPKVRQQMLVQPYIRQQHPSSSSSIIKAPVSLSDKPVLPDRASPSPACYVSVDSAVGIHFLSLPAPAPNTSASFARDKDPVTEGGHEQCKSLGESALSKPVETVLMPSLRRTLACKSKQSKTSVPITRGDGSPAVRSFTDSRKEDLLNKYYNLSGSGWKKDWDGKWIRDDAAEFDSDEEPPDLP